MKKKTLAIVVALLSTCACVNGQDLFGTWPVGGGNITVAPAEGTTVSSGGIELVAEPGILTKGENPAPFAFFIPNTALPGNVTLGVLGAPVLIDGPVELDVAVSGSAVDGDVVGSWGNGATAVSFPVTQVPEPNACLLATFGLVGLLGLRRRR